MPSLSSRTILLAIGGGIAAYKSLDLIRRLRERGATVRVVMTEAATRFVAARSSPTSSRVPRNRISAISVSPARLTW
jgi:phosphopantothenoylcysteine decarboxylase/phosphopantothenate--cysteine ligase